MNYVIIGHSGHGKVISDLILSNKKNEIIGFLDDKYKEVRLNKNLIFGPLESARYMIETFKDIKFVFAIEDNHVRKSLIENLALPEECYESLIHESAVVSSSAKIGLGTVVMPNAVINANAEIGNHAIVNTGSVVEYDCKIQDFAHICQGATLTGGVHVGKGAEICAGTTIVPFIRIGDWATVDSGATVIRDIPPFCTVDGVSAKESGL